MHELDIQQLKQPLTRENYTTKFHHLLYLEERKHDEILKERYDIFPLLIVNVQSCCLKYF